MLILDTDVLTIIQTRSGELYERLSSRLQQVFTVEPVAVTIVSLEEQLRGWLAYLNRRTVTDGDKVIVAYQRLHELVVDFQKRTVLDFDRRAYDRYCDLKKGKLRVGTMDLRIAAIALAHDATLLTRNTKDFADIPGLKIEDWTKEQETPP